MLPQDYWPKSPRLELSDAISSWISPQKLKQRSVTSGFPKQDCVDSVCHTLTHGADLGFRGAGLLPLEGKNLQSFIKAGYR